MDCDALAWHEQQDEALQTRIRLLACFTANLQGLDWRRVLPGASKGARDDPDMFDRIVDHILAPLLSERMQQAVRRSLEDEGPAVPTAPASHPQGTRASKTVYARRASFTLAPPAAVGSTGGP